MKTNQQMQVEVWKPIPEMEGFYEVSDKGNVRGVDRYVSCSDRKLHRKAQLIQVRTNEKGYCIVHLSVNGKRIKAKVHRLVAAAFIPNPSNKPEVNHLDCDKKNNVPSNLEWSTRQENMDHAADNNRIVFTEKHREGNIKIGAMRRRLSDEQLAEAKKLRLQGWTYDQLGEKYGLVGKTMQYNINTMIPKSELLGGSIN